MDLNSAHGRPVTRVAKHLPGHPLALWAACAGHGTGPTPSPTLSAATTAPQLSALAAASAVAKAVKAAVDRRALLAANTAAGRPVGGEVDGGDHCRALLAPEPAGSVAGRRDTPAEEAGKHTVRGMRESIPRSEAGGQGGAYMHAHGARALELGGGGT